MKNNFKYLLTLLIILIALFFAINFFLNKKLDSIMNDKYITLTNNINSLIKQSINDKSKATLNIALTISEFLSGNKSISKLDEKSFNTLKNISNKIKKNNNFKNLWIHVIDKNGFSRYRTWSKKRNDEIILKRKELIELIKKPKIKSFISVGIYDITFKSIIPIYENKEFVGFIEIITKFNSIAEHFKKKGIDFLILVDKKYKDQIEKPFTKKFIKDYYVANINAKNLLLKFTEDNLDNFLNIKDYQIKNNKFITKYQLNDFKNNKMAYILTFQDYNKVFSSEIDKFQNFIKAIIFLILIIFISILALFYYFDKSKYTRILEKEVEQRTKEIENLNKRYKQIFDNTSTMKFLIDPNSKKIVDVNNAVLEFYGYTKEQFSSFKTKDLNKDENIDEEMIYKKIFKDGNHRFIVKHKLANNQLKDIEIQASAINIGDKKYIYTLARDISDELKLQKEYENKQKIFYQQAKIESMGEMLENIAHQWRQPLSTITTAASGIKVKKDFNQLDDNFLNKSITTIIETSNYLSQTIEEFKNFFKHSKDFEHFKISDLIKESITLLELKLNKNRIKIKLVDDLEIAIDGYRNELIQVFLCLLNNSIDIFNEKKIKNPIIYIKISNKENIIEILFHDNANGINESIIDKIFDPYFTTKHKSLGTGIGLYMTEEIINKHYKGSISVKNSSFKIDKNEYFGAQFKIILPKSQTP